MLQAKNMQKKGQTSGEGGKSDGKREKDKIVGDFVNAVGENKWVNIMYVNCCLFFCFLSLC